MSEKTSMFELLKERLTEEETIKITCDYDLKFCELEEENKQLKYQLQQKENIINELKERSLQYSEEIDRLLDIKEEVRKYIEKASYFQGNKVLNEKDILEILDKENNNG